MKRYILFFQFILISSLLSSSVFAADMDSLRLGVPLYTEDGYVSEQFIERLNRHIRHDDIIIIKGTEESVNLLKKVKHGKTVLTSQSVSGLKEGIEFLQSRKVSIDYICYNLEVWDHSKTPESEKRDPVKAVKNARRLADENRAGFIVAPDTSITLLAYGTEIAPYADIFIVQFQRWQELKRKTFKNTVSKTVWWVEKGNPDIPVFAQLANNPPAKDKNKGDGAISYPEPEQILRKVKSLSKHSDGVVFLLNKEEGGLDRFSRLLELVRPLK